MNMRFENPPINELIVAAYFDPPLLKLRNEHRNILVKNSQQLPDS